MHGTSLRKPSHFIACAGGLGWFPRAPGTAGSLLAFPLWFAVRNLPFAGQLALVATLYLAGVWATGRTAKDLQRNDPPVVVWDEVVGCLVALLLVPAGWRFQVGAFALFRLLDIAKPWPISFVQRRVEGGNGIMLDDLLAGLAAGGSVILIIRYL